MKVVKFILIVSCFLFLFNMDNWGQDCQQIFQQRQYTDKNNWTWKFNPNFYVEDWDPQVYGNSNNPFETVKQIILNNISGALSYWGSYAGISFSYVSSGDADITIGFEGLGDTGGYCYSPTYIVFNNNSFKWTTISYHVNVDNGYHDFFSNAIHELGHAVCGPGHTGENTSVMQAWFNRVEGGFNVRRSLNSCDIWRVKNLYYKDVIAKNSFEGGKIQINSSIYDPVPIGGATATLKKNAVNYVLATDNQYIYDNSTSAYYFRAFKTWSQSGNNLYRSIEVDETGLFQADFLKKCNLTFTNNINGGTVVVSGTSYQVPKIEIVKEEDQVTVFAPIEQNNVNGLDYVFSSWSDGITTNSRTISPTQHQTHISNYNVVKPSNIGEGVYFNNEIGEPITMYWTDNVNPNVTYYDIWRKIKINGVWQNPSNIGSVNRGVQTFTDYSYVLQQWHTGLELQYDVRGYYTGNGTYQDPYWSSVYGMVAPKQVADEKYAEAIPNTNDLSSFPNPFNPVTVINYKLVKDGMVTIKVYDMLGKEVKTLLHENRNAGSYQVGFDGSNLTSGIYFATIQSNNFSKTIKLLLTK